MEAAAAPAPVPAPPAGSTNDDEEEERCFEMMPEVVQREIEAFLEDCPPVAARYRVTDRIGEGTFSTVYKAHLIDDPSRLVALKHVYLISSPVRIDNEARYLALTGGRHNVGRLVDGLRHHDQVVLVLEYFEHTKIHDLLAHITEHDIRCYLRSLLEALASVHRSDVIHRDVKPTNFLYNRETGKGYLVDFGLAQDGPARPKTATVAPFSPPPTPTTAAAPVGDGSPRKPPPKTVFAPAAVLQKAKPLAGTAVAGKRPGLPAASTAARAIAFDQVVERQSRPSRHVRIPLHDTRPRIKASRAGTRGFRAPEILLKVVNQTGAVDVWSAGIVLLTLITCKYPFFLAHDDMYALYELRLIFGFEAMRAAAVKMGRVLVESYDTCTNVAAPLRPNGTVDWRAFCERANPAVRGKYPDDMYDLLDRLLTLDPAERITAKHAYAHPFLKPATGPAQPVAL